MISTTDHVIFCLDSDNDSLNSSIVRDVMIEAAITCVLFVSLVGGSGLANMWYACIDNVHYSSLRTQILDCSISMITLSPLK